MASGQGQEHDEVDYLGTHFPFSIFSVGLHDGPIPIFSEIEMPPPPLTRCHAMKKTTSAINQFFADMKGRRIYTSTQKKGASAGSLGMRNALNFASSLRGTALAHARAICLYKSKSWYLS